MPELPEVENFRQLLLPVVDHELTVEVKGDHPRIKVDEFSNAHSREASGKLVCTDVLRRGKQICLVLSRSRAIKYMYLHMGMTGSIRVHGKAENWGEKKESGPTDVPLDSDPWPPKYTCIIFASPTTNYTAYFCDPRKFGSAYIANDLTDFESLAPDALTCSDPTIVDGHILPSITNQRLGIKAILLDQKRAVSGVGNWVADEVLYQCKMHPDQTKLDACEAAAIYEKLHDIVCVAVQSLKEDRSYPENWLFHYRWTGKKSGKDAEGRSISFITSGGRTSAIINTLQKLYSRNAPSKTSSIKKTKVKKEIASDLSSPIAVISVDEQKKNTPTSRTKVQSKTISSKAVDKAEMEVKSMTSTIDSSRKKRSKPQTESSRTKTVSDLGTKDASSKIKRQRVAGNKVVSDYKVTSQRKSPRLSADKS